MRVERKVLLVVAFQEQGCGGCYLRRVAVALPAVSDLTESHGRIHCRCGVGKHLEIVYLVILLGSPEDPEVNLQLLVKGKLRDIQLCREITVVLVPDYRLSPHITQRSTVVRLLTSTAESNMMCIDKACPYHLLLEISVKSLVYIVQSQCLCCTDILGRIQHSETFIYVFETYCPVIIDLELAALATLRPYLDDTRRTPRTVLGRLGGILENGKALDVGRINGRQGGQVGRHSINDDQRVVAAGKRGSTTHTHACQHGHTVLSVRDDIHAHSLSGQSVERRTDQTFVHLFLSDSRYRPDDGKRVIDVERQWLLNRNMWLVLSLGICHNRRNRHQKAANNRMGNEIMSSHIIIGNICYIRCLF